MKKAYGGVVIDPSGKVLLREAADHYKGHVWTFAKGKPEPGESPEQTAMREVLEETGVHARIIIKIPEAFDGSTTSNEYFLMSPIEDTARFDAETQRTTWATKKRARDLILLTTKPKRRRRDLRLLKVAFQLFDSLRAAEYPEELLEAAAALPARLGSAQKSRFPFGSP